MSNLSPINDTDYCTLWKRVLVPMESGGFAAMELITVKELDREEIRFSYYKEGENGELKFIPRPLDLPISELNKLITEAVKEGLINFNISVK